MVCVPRRRVCCTFAAFTGLDLSYQDGSHVGKLVDDWHHEWTGDVSLHGWKGVDVWDE